MKEKYKTPTVKVVEFKAECGFASSMIGRQNDNLIIFENEPHDENQATSFEGIADWSSDWTD